MLRAIGTLKRALDVRLVLLGRLEDSELVGEIEANSSTEYLGLVPHEKVWSYLQDADVGLLLYYPVPNSIWSRPNKLFEYMMAGLPVVASNMPGWREFIEGHECGLCVDPLDPKQIPEAIEFLITHPEEARRMGKNGRRAVLEKYNWETEGQKLLDLYEVLLT
jgi:glycosyltransferase involved in cell wall biosynthesis